jgi:hypothetical protein
MTKPIDFEKDPENNGINREIHRLNILINSDKNREIKAAKELLELNGYYVKKINKNESTLHNNS